MRVFEKATGEALPDGNQPAKDNNVNQNQNQGPDSAQQH